MKMSEMYPSKYMKCADLGGQRRQFVIESVVRETVGQDPNEPQKPIIYFRGGTKTLVLNKVNANTIADSLGDDTDKWIGAAIVLMPSRTSYQGKMTDCIRIASPVRPPQSTAVRAPAAPPDDAPPDEALDDIPF